MLIELSLVVSAHKRELGTWDVALNQNHPLTTIQPEIAPLCPGDYRNPGSKLAPGNGGIVPRSR